MIGVLRWTGVALLFGVVESNNRDLFNYDYPSEPVPGGGGVDYGQPYWGSVTCDDLDTCTGYPDKFLHSIGFSVEGPNFCRWCPEGGPEDCGLHRQSPIDLKRECAIEGNPIYNECIDWHFMRYQQGTCSWSELQDQFTVNRNSLRFSIPQLSNGQIACTDDSGKRQYPRLDYSKGFPDWWWLDHVDIITPSNHVQEGKRYDAEMKLGHFYSEGHSKNQLGYVSIFMESYVGVESWSFLDKLICQWRLEEEKVRSACGVDPAPDYGRCRLFRGQTPSKEWLISAGLSPPDGGNVQSLQPMATESPVVTQQAATAVAPDTAVVPDTPVIADIDCSSYNVDYSRMCANSNTACCDDVRSDSDFCWDIYEKIFPGDLMSSACNHCCPDGPKTVGPPHPEKSGLPKTIQCSDVENPFRICGGCCDDPRSTTSYCKDVYEQYGDSVEELCYYCCSVSRDVGQPNRNLRVSAKATDTQRTEPDLKSIAVEDIVSEGGKLIYADGKKHYLREEDFKEYEDSDEEWFGRMYTDFKHREMQTTVHELDYADVPFFEYEGLIKVETEYYFRYEGTMLVPPCWDVVHWRVMKDPIRVNRRQVDELNRLLAWRLSPSGANQCEVDTAGRLRGDGNRDKVFRDLQYFHPQHRMVFCECSDWPSKFPADQAWCKNWRTEDKSKRFFSTPYNFDSGGVF